ncbi:MobQ family relaxase [Cytobacillus oceanisediminis]|uniref:MobQ family relaxase n=1 Tax=Cytobacillus oceanisediminis TaxID=665099 RepID=UPI0011A6169A|nr:MobQ family relaxase [Cytobacillus oceanisediminis]
MAIYHLSMQIISRSKGQSAVASAAYRSGEKLNDQRTNEDKFYRREIQPETMILAPSHAPEWVQDRNRLWNEVEKIEKRKDAQLARELNIALPRELSNDLQKELVREYVQEQFVNKGMIADIAIHRDDEENPHVHIMLTTREISAEGFGQKNRDWNQRALLEKWREEWANFANKALEREGIQERISHLSHEARGLEQLPTVHLGHVAHEMEERGIQTDRGNINREREEYNALVVDLQKYREEKKTLEEKKARQQEQKQKSERFTTDVERVELQAATKILKAEASLPNIKKRYEQLDKWDERLNKNDSYIRWKDEAIRKASEHFERIHSFEKQIQEAEKQIENLNWLNPLKLKENKNTKAATEQAISQAEGEIHSQNEKLNYHREKLGFSTEEEFNQVKTEHEKERAGLLEKNRNTRRYIISERDVLQKAENALKKAFVRQVASLYPKRPEMAHMTFRTAINVMKINQKHGNGKVIPIENIEKVLNNKKQEVQKLKGDISNVDQTKLRLKRAEAYLKEFEELQTIIDKYEKDPYLKGKMIVSKETKQNYERAVNARDAAKEFMQNEGISGRAEFEKQTEQLGKIEVKIPEFKEKIQFEEGGLGLFDAVIRGIEQAGRELTKEQHNGKEEDQKGKKKKKKNIHQSQELTR